MRQKKGLEKKFYRSNFTLTKNELDIIKSQVSRLNCSKSEFIRVCIWFFNEIYLNRKG